MPDPNWKIELKNIGRNKINKTIETSMDTLPQAEAKALKECSRHLASRNIDIEYKEDLTYKIYAGFHNVGEVRISSM